MSEVKQAPAHLVPPQGPEAVPARPPSRPSRLPRYIWTGIALFCLIMFGSALALFFWSREALSSNDLKTATAFRINYITKGNLTKSVDVNDPAEVKRLLDALQIHDSRMGPQFNQTAGGSVVFTLPRGKSATVKFLNQGQLERADWGWVFVSSEFYQKVNEAASRAEGRRIDVMRVDN
jgi:hypothetical protein